MYLKATILEMTTQDFNNVFLNGYNDVISFEQIKEGTYIVYVTRSKDVHLYSSSNPNQLVYRLKSDCYYKLIPLLCKDKNKYKDLELNGEIYHDYNSKLICEKVNDKKNNIYIQIVDKERQSVKLSDIERITPNFSFIVSDFKPTEYGGILISKDNKKYSVNKRAMKRIRKHCEIKDGKIMSTYNENPVEVELTYESWDEYKFNMKNEKTGKDEEHTSSYQTIKLTIGNKSRRFFVNKPYSMDYKHENKYEFLYVYIDNVIVGYDIIRGKYFKIPDDEVKLILSKVNKQIKDDYNRGKNLDIYSYIIHDKKKYSIVIEYKKDEKTGKIKKSVYPKYVKRLPKDMLDITKLIENEVVDEKDVPTERHTADSDFDKAFAEANNNESDDESSDESSDSEEEDSSGIDDNIDNEISEEAGDDN